MTIRTKLGLSLLSVSLVVLIDGYFALERVAKKNETKIYAQIKNSLITEIEFKFRSKKFVGLTNAISLANDKEIKEALINNDRDLAINTLEHLVKNYKEATPFKNIKIHIHTKNLKSFVRLWNLEEFGDDLSFFRHSIVKVKKTKKPLSVYEIGKAGFSLRSIAPILDEDGKYLGSLEFIQGVDVIAKALEKNEDGFLLLMNKSKAKIEFFNKKNIFKEDYLISQVFVNKIFLQDAKNIDMHKLLKDGFYKSDKFFYSYVNKNGLNNKILGIALIGTPLSKINAAIDASEEMLDVIIIIIAILAILLLITLMITIRNFILIPLDLLNKSLNSFFEYLQNPKKEIKYIPIAGNDEFAQMGENINESIKVSSQMHIKISNLMQTMDKNVIASETDENGIITHVSEAFCKISGYTEDELIGYNYNNYNIINDSKESDDILNDMYKTIENKNIWRGEVKNIKKDDSFYWVDMIVTPKCIQENSSCGYTTISYDITAKKEVEDLTKNLELKVQKRTEELSLAKQKIEDVNNQMRDSIEYASLIQGALISNGNNFNKYFNDHFIIWEPKDIVGGDIFLFEEFKEKDECIIMCIDCTGHGVAGAFVTVLVKAIERSIIARINSTNEDISPARLLGVFNRSIKHLLKQEEDDNLWDVGFDAGIIYYNKSKQLLKYAGAKIPLYYIDNTHEVKVIKGDSYSVGYKSCDAQYEYKDIDISVEKGMKFYVASDGFIDQKGGDKGFSFGKTRFKNIIEQNYELSMSKQKGILLNELNKYQGEYFRIDDITLIGLEIK